ncbi:hypothetical protein [Rhizobium rhizogenes]|uniref:Uncharacterized protein n=2 Tax=Rhizobium/Agrobacterium group TaxID=227290 RepID=K7WNA9_AGRTU|nr:hypothetical protein [Rhizobium rhizogenes]AFX65695.1 Hypothetical protein [Agrobacterium radiobacter]GAJ95445.1 hypothetical protein RRH01S_12_00020 [Rhizobium rhizogenes NBRC 13257]NTI85111.1 hypothetical protein [Rhizobium rhizogenes]NTJ27445.1 hypothetical protein [Rhizobium rhizogenes]QUE84904.1 hypothetical protein EML492_33615 [Rhizobium rhizogenes]
MRQQTKPFIVERKPSRKPKSDATRTAIWGKLDLRQTEYPRTAPKHQAPTAIAGDDGRR